MWREQEGVRKKLEGTQEKKEEVRTVSRRFIQELSCPIESVGSRVESRRKETSALCESPYHLIAIRSPSKQLPRRLLKASASDPQD